MTRSCHVGLRVIVGSQCLRNIQPLTEHVTSADFLQQHVNKTNKFGLQGRLAQAYSELMHVMRSEQCVDVAPGFVKALISEKVRDTAIRLQRRRW